MSLPQRLYELYREVVNCELVQHHKTTPENIALFQFILNKTWPENDVEMHQRDLVRAMYNSRKRGFLDYIQYGRNRVGALILWTESKNIARYFGLNGIVHINWDKTNNTYTVTEYVPRETTQQTPTREENRPVTRYRDAVGTKKPAPKLQRRRGERNLNSTTNTLTPTTTTTTETNATPEFSDS